jgi:allophanate hydrolase subunit 1
VSIFDSRFDNPAVFSPGDAVTFVPVSTHEFHKIELAVAAGDYALSSAEHKS